MCFTPTLTARTGSIADTLNREHGLHFTRAGAPTAVLGRAQTGKIGLMQFAQQDMVKINPPLIFAERGSALRRFYHGTWRISTRGRPTGVMPQSLANRPNASVSMRWS